MDKFALNALIKKQLQKEVDQHLKKILNPKKKKPNKTRSENALEQSKEEEVEKTELNISKINTMTGMKTKKYSNMDLSVIS